MSKKAFVEVTGKSASVTNGVVTSHEYVIRVTIYQSESLKIGNNPLNFDNLMVVDLDSVRMIDCLDTRHLSQSEIQFFIESQKQK